MSANLFLAPVPPQGVKGAAPFHNRGNVPILPAFNKPAHPAAASHLTKSRSSNLIKTNGEISNNYNPFFFCP